MSSTKVLKALFPEEELFRISTVGPMFGVPAFKVVIVWEFTLPTTRNLYCGGGGGGGGGRILICNKK